jgi:hypothetical protein
MCSTGRPRLIPDDGFTRWGTKIHRRDVLRRAWAAVRRNNGAPGVDATTLAEVEEYGVDRLLGELAVELKELRWRPLSARRVFIPKPGTAERRPLSILSVRDRNRAGDGTCRTVVLILTHIARSPGLRSAEKPYGSDMRCWNRPVIILWSGCSASLYRRSRNSYIEYQFFHVGDRDNVEHLYVAECIQIKLLFDLREKLNYRKRIEVEVCYKALCRRYFTHPLPGADDADEGANPAAKSIFIHDSHSSFRRCGADRLNLYWDAR